MFYLLNPHLNKNKEKRILYDGKKTTVEFASTVKIYYGLDYYLSYSLQTWENTAKSKWNPLWFWATSTWST